MLIFAAGRLGFRLDGVQVDGFLVSVGVGVGVMQGFGDLLRKTWVGVNCSVGVLIRT